MKKQWIKKSFIFPNKWSKISSIIAITLLTLYFSLINFVNPTQIGIARNIISGETWIQDGNGINITSPWTFVAKIDTRPIKVEINSAGHGYSAKLVQFNKNHWKNFVQTEGIYYYWFANRISFNFGYDTEHRGIKDIMRGYAYSPQDYDFMIIIKEYRSK